MARYEVPLSTDILELLTNHGATLVSGPRQPGITTTVQTRLEKALSTLTIEESTVIWLKFWEHMSFREIQRELNHKSVSMTHRTYRKAMTKLTTALTATTTEAQNENDC